MNFNFETTKKTLWNPTPYPIHLYYNLRDTVLKPFEKIDTGDSDFVRNAYFSYGELGLVILNENEVTDDMTFEQYVANKEIEGLKRCLEFKKICLDREIHAVQEVKLKNGLNDEAAIKNRKHIFVKDIEYLTKLLIELSKDFEVSPIEEYTIPVRPEWKKNVKEKKETKKQSDNIEVGKVLNSVLKG